MRLSTFALLASLFLPAAPAAAFDVGPARAGMDETASIDLPLAGGGDRGAWDLRATAGYAERFERDGDSMPFGVAATLRLADDIAAAVELIGALPVASRSDYELGAQAGITWQFGEDVAVRGAMGRTLRTTDDDGRATTIRIGIGFKL